jgi:hypothetical protein
MITNSRKTPGVYCNPPPPVTDCELAKRELAREIRSHAALIALAESHFFEPYRIAPIVVYKCSTYVLARAAIPLASGGFETTATCEVCGGRVEAGWVVLSVADAAAFNWAMAVSRTP